MRLELGCWHMDKEDVVYSRARAPWLQLANQQRGILSTAEPEHPQLQQMWLCTMQSRLSARQSSEANTSCCLQQYARAAASCQTKPLRMMLRLQRPSACALQRACACALHSRLHQLQSRLAGTLRKDTEQRSFDIAGRAEQAECYAQVQTFKQLRCWPR